MFNYLLHSSLLLLLTFVIYRLLLHRETFFSLNRFVLLLMIFLSVTLPFFEIPENWSLRSRPGNLMESVTWVGTLQKGEVENDFGSNANKKNAKKASIPENTPGIDLSYVLLWIYLTGVVVFLLTFIVQMVQLETKSKKLKYMQDGRFRIYELESNTPPFSFFNNIYVNPTLYEYETFEQILAHEKLHIRNRHFIDKLAAEVLVIFFWFNPFVWLLRKAMTNNLEFQTDGEMLDAGVERQSYQMSLLKVSVTRHPLSFTTNYNQSILEKRIRMMNAKKSSTGSFWKYLMILPIFSLTLLSFNPVRDNKVEGASSDFKHTEQISINGTFDSSSRDNTFYLANITGKVVIEGHDKENIEISVIKTIDAPTEKEIDKGVEEVSVAWIGDGDSFSVYLKSPYSTFDADSKTFTYSENCDGKPCFQYQFVLNYIIKVPRNANLVVQNVNGGDITINQVNADRIKVNHITGSIIMRDVTGSTNAETISGSISVDYGAVPSGQSSFKTISGFIEASFPKNFSGEVYQKAGDGEFSTDFDVEDMYNKNDLILSQFKIGTCQ